VHIAVIMVNWRNEPETLRCAEAVRGWSMLKQELIVVDNESTMASRKALAGGLDPHCLILSETNLGYGGGNNLGIKQALSGRAEYFLLLNSDTEISEGRGWALEQAGSQPRHFDSRSRHARATDWRCAVLDRRQGHRAECLDPDRGGCRRAHGAAGLSA
jgi:glycosyltransferase involved in cell wall biosynthesis